MFMIAVQVKEIFTVGNYEQMERLRSESQSILFLMSLQMYEQVCGEEKERKNDKVFSSSDI